jgi:high-affinity Fe2+/Pb2+ permease
MEIVPALIAMGVFLLLIFGWAASGEERLTPRSGLGYWLGVAGASMMVALMAYCIRKRTNGGPRATVAIPVWLRFHMILGIAGPILILFHCNFRFGALNSNVALMTMVIVAFSGVAGRYLYRLAYRSQLNIFERLLGTWRLFHAPLCFVLAVSTVVHIWAVHRY